MKRSLEIVSFYLTASHIEHMIEGIDRFICTKNVDYET